VTVDEILQRVLALPSEERARLLDELLRSLEPDQDDTPTDPAWEEAWAAELNRRAQEIDEGRAQLIPHEEVFAELRARFPPR